MLRRDGTCRLSDTLLGHMLTHNRAICGRPVHDMSTHENHVGHFSTVESFVGEIF